MSKSAARGPRAAAPSLSDADAVPTPLYQRIYETLRADLDAGRWSEGELMPSERSLAEAFGCSLITLRRALDELARENRISRERGRGTFALAAPIERNLTALTSFSDEMRDLGFTPRTRIISAQLVEATMGTSRRLGLDQGSAVYRIRRLRFAASTPLMLEDVELPAALFPGLLETDLENRSLYDVMANDYGLPVESARETIEAIILDADEAELLDQAAGRPALLLDLVSLTYDGVAVERCRSIVRCDRTVYSHELKRDKPTRLALIPGGRGTSSPAPKP